MVLASSSIALSMIVPVHNWSSADVQWVMQLDWTWDYLRAGAGFLHIFDSPIVLFGSGFNTNSEL